MKIITHFVDEREAFSIIYGYDPLTGNDYEMEEINECEVRFLPIEESVA